MKLNINFTLSRLFFAFSVLCLLSITVLCAGCSSEPKKSRILVFCGHGEGYVHDNIGATAKMLVQLGQEHEFVVYNTTSKSVFTDRSLSKFDAIVYANASYVDLDESQKAAFQKFIRSGGGFMGIHAATCTDNKWEWFTEMIGANFESHPPLHEFTVKKTDETHPAVASFPSYLEVNDELYMFNHINPNINVLMVAESPQVEGSYPSVWCHEFEGGRVWYTALGHLEEDYSLSWYRNLIMDGLSWILEKDIR